MLFPESCHQKEDRTSISCTAFRDKHTLTISLVHWIGCGLLFESIDEFLDDWDDGTPAEILMWRLPGS